MAYFAKDLYTFSFVWKSSKRFCWSFAGWRVPDSNNGVFYVFTVLPFGLSAAPYIFAEILKPSEKHRECRVIA